jgi:uncharacterized SAM-binding protein YcdF (DUF218 family)
MHDDAVASLPPAQVVSRPIAIVVLGAQNDDQGGLSSIAKERCHQALAEYRKHAGARLVLTGGWGRHFNTTARPHVHYVREYLEAHGIPAEAIAACIESSSTVEDARLCRPVVQRDGLRKLIVVTSDFHVARAELVFRREFPDLAIELSASRTHLPEEELRHRITHERHAIARLKHLP